MNEFKANIASKSSAIAKVFNKVNVACGKVGALGHAEIIHLGCRR